MKLKSIIKASAVPLILSASVFFVISPISIANAANSSNTSSTNSTSGTVEEYDTQEYEMVCTNTLGGKSRCEITCNNGKEITVMEGTNKGAKELCREHGGIAVNPDFDNGNRGGKSAKIKGATIKR